MPTWMTIATIYTDLEVALLRKYGGPVRPVAGILHPLVACHAQPQPIQYRGLCVAVNPVLDSASKRLHRTGAQRQQRQQRLQLGTSRVRLRVAGLQGHMELIIERGFNLLIWCLWAKVPTQSNALSWDLHGIWCVFWSKARWSMSPKRRLTRNLFPLY